MMSTTRISLSLILASMCAISAVAQEKIDYLRRVKPILKRHCYECHNEKKQKGRLSLLTAADIRKGGRNGEAIVPGNAEKSLLIQSLRGDALLVPKMPHKRTPLKAKEIALLSKWINQGANAPANETVAKHWSFEAPKRPELPAVDNEKWVRNPIDYFISAKLEKNGLQPSSPAEKATLIRRLYFDVLGLPPSVNEVDRFMKDDSPDAYDRLVDHVLASPHYGERWGRHWLDIARYADSNGFTIDSPREIWLYRDWVVNALNKNIPFDQFVIEQYAGDMLPGATKHQKIATGFHRNTLINQEGGIDREQFRVDAVADRVDTTGVVFLGLTLGCARCHDHKYDPISQQEYYQLFAFLNNQSEPKIALATPVLEKKRDAIEKQIAKKEEELNGPLQAFVKKLSEEELEKIKDNISMILRLRPDQRTDSQKKSLEKYFSKKDPKLKKGFAEIASLKRKLPDFPTTMVLKEMSRPRETTIHIKGDFTRKGERVYPEAPAILHELPKRKNKDEQYDRLDLAKWLVDPRNPLVGRVTMNRIWQRYFGEGLVATENDFGTQGALPTHPKLLDWLAVEFVENGWDLKHMHKLILTSAIYRQSSHVRDDLAKADPNNQLLGRQNRLRLDAEIIRDNALAVSGMLSLKMGGPSVYPPQPTGVYAFTQVKRRWNTSKGADRFRRGLYTFFQRSAPYPMLTTFDAPNANSTCTRRVRSNTPLQALTLLNDRAFMEIAYGLAQRVLSEAPKTNASRMEHLFRVCLAREPQPSERSILDGYVSRQLSEFAKSPNEARQLLQFCGASKDGDTNITEQAAWTATARVVMNLDEFITRE